MDKGELVVNSTQQLRLECLQVAARIEKTKDGILEASKMFYEFVSDQRPSELELRKIAAVKTE